MKKTDFNIIKDICISILIVICLILLFSVIFYDKTSLGKVVPEVEEYKLTNEMQNDLEDTYSQDATEVITTYSIDAAELKKYEKTKEYNKGKANPFEETTSENSNNNSVKNNASSNEIVETSNNKQSGFYEDDGTK